VGSRKVQQKVQYNKKLYEFQPKNNYFH
jgi:hypothetical protein